jgi:hypothetical protein
MRMMAKGINFLKNYLKTRALDLLTHAMLMPIENAKRLTHSVETT